ncbi:DNA repair protein RecN [Halarsenatibacter silvermanii]|uniref:DNA repair protein RecN n=1 Tax=Halarsenatibacter silvermanii TaxID=321763 RepID=A0A1G9PKM1_9FIRM|nr:DNA repair protein RecN [Halarsenatibacter silvermanii]SDL99376.1 DNA replication and repair protein RecN [Halarsenatibacter silvermanii]
MLGDLVLKNFAIIEEANISFCQGLNILTGETGAGKSIIIRALEMLFGGRADSSVIKDGKNAAFIEANYFTRDSEKIDSIISEAGVEPEDEGLIISREIRRSGRNRCRINGQLVPLWLIREVGSKLVDIHGQHEHQSLIRSSNHRDILDQFLSDEGFELRREIADGYAELKDLTDRREELSHQASDRERRLDIIDYQLEEIDSANLEEGELEEVKQELSRLNHQEEIHSITGEAGELVNGSEYEEGALLDSMGDLKAKLNSIAEYDSELAELSELAEEIYYSLQDLGYRLRDYHEDQVFDPGRVRELEERLDTINTLKRKYGESIEEIIAYRQELEEERQELEQLEERLKEVDSRMENLRKKLMDKAQKLSLLREKAAENLEKEIENQLEDLALSEARFSIELHSREELNSAGLDDVQFKIAVNPGTELKRLDRVASGGELSRIMLAFKTITAETESVETIIFDEIDAGVGGKTALRVADKLAALSLRHQVISITHLPQLASMADRHFYIEKETDSEKETVATEVESLDKEERKTELSRMLSGREESSTGFEHAEEMLARAERIKSDRGA